MVYALKTTPPSPWLGLRILTIIVFIVCHDGVMSDSNSLTVRYQVRSYRPLNFFPRCNNMDSTIMLDYREIGMDTTGLVGGWINLAVIPAQNDLFGILSTDTISFSISEEHVQFRFLQLVHDRGGCNCWRDQQLWITYIDEDNSQTHLDLTATNNLNTCTRNNNETRFFGGDTRYCGGAVNEPRGLITRVVYSDGSSGDDNNKCPGDSNNLLSEYAVTATAQDTTIKATTTTSVTENTGISTEIDPTTSSELVSMEESKIIDKVD